MANMTFKANLLPNTDLGYSLGSSTLRWNIYGNITPTGTTAQFYRGDNNWSNTLTGNLSVTNGGIFKVDHTDQGATTAGTSYNAFCIQFKNSTNDATYTAYPIRYIGTDGTDTYNSCIVLGSQNGTTWLGAGESSSNMPKIVEYNSENLYLSSDGGIFAYTGCANDASSSVRALTLSSSGHLNTPNGNIWAGTNGNTTGERQVGVQSGAGQLYLYSVASTTGNRGLYVTAHGTGSAKNIIVIDTNNNATFNGNAATATKWATARTLTIGNTGKSVDGSTNVSWSKAEIIGSGTTANYLRGDHSWTNTLTGTYISTASPGFQNSVSAGSWSYLRLHNGNNLWDIATKSDNLSGALEFRPGGAASKGPYITTAGNLVITSGMTWPAPQNIACTASANSQEWSIDMANTDYTGTYWHVWSGKNSASCLQCFNDNRHVIIPVHLAVGGYNNTTYALSTASFISNSWVRTKGNTGWYNEDYGGGWYMSDTSWIRSYGSKNIYQNTGILRTDGQFQCGGDGSHFYANSSGNAYIQNSLGIAGTNTSYKLYVNGAIQQGANTQFHQKTNTTLGTAPSANQYMSGLHWLDTNNVDYGYVRGIHFTNQSIGLQIEARRQISDAWKYNTLNLQVDTSGNAVVGINGTNAAASWRAAIGAAASSHTHSYLPLSGGAMTGAIQYNGKGQCSLYNGPNDQFAAVGGTLNNFVISSWWGVSFTTACTGQTYSGKTAVSIDCRNGLLRAAKVYGAVWNDYAEYRQSNELEPGRCIVENGDGTLSRSTQRLQKGCEIVSDTYGFAIGESSTCKTPTATCGRVLAYLYENMEKAKQHIGDPVCSGPNGTVSIMTEEEEMRYPSRIIGTISEIPDYDTWHAGSQGQNKSEEIEVNGRIWIRIR